MARWRLTASHYLNVPGTEWEYTENSRTTGRPERKKFKVPMLLDVNDPQAWTEFVTGGDGKPIEGYIIVSDGTNPEPRDVIFEGDPTPDMRPVDDAARAISDKFKDRWIHPIDSLPGTGAFADSMINSFTAQIAALQAGQAGPQNVSLAGVSQESFVELQTQVSELVKQNSILLSKLLEKPEATRRV